MWEKLNSKTYDAYTHDEDLAFCFFVVAELNNQTQFLQKSYPFYEKGK